LIIVVIVSIVGIVNLSLLLLLLRISSIFLPIVADINWGSSTQAHVYRNALQYSQRLTMILEHVKNYRWVERYHQMLHIVKLWGSQYATFLLCVSVGHTHKFVNYEMVICKQMILEWLRSHSGGKCIFFSQCFGNFY